MKIADPYALRNKPQKATFLAVASQLQGIRRSQQDFFASYHDECFVLADGVGSMPHGDVAAKLASETAVWAYKHVGQRPYYWEEKEKLLRRIFRSTNLTIWQKRREDGFGDGLATTMTVVIISPNKFWIGNVGNTSAYLCREDLIDEITVDDTDERGYLTNVLGVKRLGLVPHIAREPFLPYDCILLATDGVTSFLDEDQMRVALSSTGVTRETMSQSLAHILQEAQDNGSTDNMSACIIKYIPSDA